MTQVHLAAPASGRAARFARHPSRAFAPALLISSGVLGLAVTASILLGSRNISPLIALSALFSPDATNTDHLVVLELRIPRTIVGLVAGVALGMAGALMQGLTRNPLADPGLLGVNAGAALGVVAGISFFGVSSPIGYVWWAFAGAAVAAVLVYTIGSAGETGATPVRLALTGVALTATITSLTSILLLANLDTFEQFRFWSAGSLVARGLSEVFAVAPFIVVGAALALVLGRSINTLSLGDDAAVSLGARPNRIRVLTAAAIVLLCGSATALAGPIVFVGLAVPHIARRLVGHDYRAITALSALLGAALLVLADVIGRVVVRPGELEAGIVVAFLGAPVLIALVRRSRIASV